MIRRRSLYWHIFPWFLAVIVVALTGVTLYGTTAMERFFLEQTREDLTVRGRMLIPQVLGFLSGSDATALRESIRTQGRLSGTRLTLIDPFGEILAESSHRPDEMDNHASRPEIAAALQGALGSEIRFSRTLRKRMMYVAIPVTRGDGTIAAVIRAALPVSALDDKLGAIRLRVLLGGIGIAVLTVVLSVFVSRRISRPIESVRRGAERLAAGSLEKPLPIPDAAELAELSRAMNRMAEEIQRRIHQAESRSGEIEAILASMVEGVIAVDMAEKVLRINAPAVDMLSLAPDAVEGRPLHELVRNTAFHRLLEDSVQNGAPCEQDILVYTPEEQTLCTRMTPLMDAGGQRLGTLIVMNNVTHLRRLEHMRRDFAANVSHEIKTPLTAIKGFVETLRLTTVEDPEATARFLEIIEKHVNRLAAIIEDLMQLSRIERDSVGDGLMMKAASLKDILQTAVQVCTATAEERQVAIDLDVDADVTVLADVPLLEQAAVNLLDNAVKYSGAGQRIRVGARVADAEVRLFFEDHGPGIPRKHLPRLFERFYRVDKARSRQMGGTGLGLAIVKHIVQAHGGRITVESEVNKGSIFTVHLPRQASTPDAAAG